MFLPTNGRILIVDDKIEQAVPLINVLSKNKLPFTFHTADVNQLPATPYNDIRLIFLDINLTDGVNEDAIKAQLQATLTRLVHPGIPYILIIWSIRENEYEELISDLFDTQIPQLAPIIKVSLSKSQYFSIIPETGNYEANANIISRINTKLKSELDKIDSFKLLIYWEKMIHEAISQVILQFSSIIENDKYWSSNLKHIFYKLAHAQLGKTLKNENEVAIIQAVLKTLTSGLNDKIDFNLYNSTTLPFNLNTKKQGVNYYKLIGENEIKLKWEDLTTNVIYINSVEKGRNKVVDKLTNGNADDLASINSFKDIYRHMSPKLNTALLIGLEKRLRLQPGNVYYKPVAGSKKRKLLATYLKGIDKKNDQGFVYQNISAIRFVELECTPICDYSQKKWLRSRILPGLLLHSSFFSLLNSENDSLYKEIPPFQFENEVYKLVFDYRLFKSINLANDHNKQSNFLFRLKNDVLVDIQARISSHIIRPGITTIS